METALGRQTAGRRFSTVLVGLFAATALLLAVVGLYGILAHFVALRRRELGIRIAVGAGRGEIIGVVLRYGLSVLLAGVVLGATAAVFSVRLVSNLLFGVKAWDPLALVVVVGALAAAAIAASILPAWKATRIDPLITLRSE
jgi:ABC-type antimicrobial peptide transport system permease subunit